jgi:hypothetical protein
MFAHFFALPISPHPTQERFYRFFFSDEAQFIMLQFVEDYVVLAITSSFPGWKFAIFARILEAFGDFTTGSSSRVGWRLRGEFRARTTFK